ncbi:MAG: hypothetical protein ABIQ93_02810, partial [Saprospiraceae bacterium]
HETPKNPCQSKVKRKIRRDGQGGGSLSGQQVYVPANQIELNVFRQVHDGLYRQIEIIGGKCIALLHLRQNQNGHKSE